ncbi:mismatch-specific DNA-glycosylase [Candidatus Bathyarchaeota archaeon]|nr:mismatch-specific DNA-glycosylase [Candidatus Bathyarchaeota archaeon]
MNSLPDYLEPKQKVVFVGTNPGRLSVLRGHYFARPGNHFWRLLHESGLVPAALTSEQDTELPNYGYGLTDIVKKATRSIKDLRKDDYEKGIMEFKDKMGVNRPCIICFVGINPFRKYFKFKDKLDFGPRPEKIHSSRVFIIPTMSGLYPMTYDRKLTYFKALNMEVSRLRSQGA